MEARQEDVMNMTIDGHVWKSMFAAGVRWLEKIVPDINALNVYPVPDGDCGTNMTFTMRASLAEAEKCSEVSVGAVTEAIATGALMGARGNSGVILSQIFRGLKQGLAGKDEMTGKDLADALREAATTAHDALSHPVDGTILTVIRCAAEAAEAAAADNAASPVSVMEAVITAAREAVIDTPNLLDVLREAGVVDAGGHGLFTFFEGALLELKGETDGRSPEVLASLLPVLDTQVDSDEDEAYGFCTQFMLKGNNLDIARLRGELEGMGKSVIVVGDESVIRVHIHTPEPDAVIARASGYGKVNDIDIGNMDEQHQEYLLVKRDKKAPLPIAVIAVVQGEGMVKVFTDLGVAAVIPGGQTMNPSTMDFLETIVELPSDNIILLPNNKNVVPAAQLVQTLADKNVRVVPTETIPQGIAALVAFVPELDFVENIAEMMESYRTVRTIEVTRSTRDTKVADLEIKNGQIIGLLNGKLLAAGDNATSVVLDLLERCRDRSMEIVTVYYGKETDEAAANALAAEIGKACPGLEIGVVAGGQPHYPYMISVE